MALFSASLKFKSRAREIRNSESNFGLGSEDDSVPFRMPSCIPTGHSCPDILELQTGDFAVIGKDITEQAIGSLPSGSGCGMGEPFGVEQSISIVLLPLSCLLDDIFQGNAHPIGQAQRCLE